MHLDHIPVGANVKIRLQDESSVNASGIVIDNQANCGSATLEVLIQGQRKKLFVQPWLVEVIDVNPNYAAIADRILGMRREKAERNGWNDFLRKEQVSAENHLLGLLKSKIEVMNALGEKIMSAILPPAELYRQWLKLQQEVDQIKSHDIFKRSTYLSHNVPVISPDWDKFFRFKDSWVYKSRQILTPTYIGQLGDYLSQRVAALFRQRKVKILDVASGIDVAFNACLSHHLDQRNPNQFDFLSADTLTEDSLKRYLLSQHYSQGGAEREAAYAKSQNDKVKKSFEGTKINFSCLDVKEAVNSFCPDIVICSWMPKDADFTRFFRDASPVVQEYILIGPQRCCGNEKTWNNFPGFKKEEILTACPDLDLNIYRFPSNVWSFKR